MSSTATTRSAKKATAIDDAERRRAPRVRPTIDTGTQTRVDPSNDEIDVDDLMRKAMEGGGFPSPMFNPGTHGDFSNALTLHEAMTLAQSAREAFDNLPGPVREAAGFDPVQFSRMLSDSEGLEALQSAGLQLPAPETSEVGNAGSADSPASQGDVSPPSNASPEGAQPPAAQPGAEKG